MTPAELIAMYYEVGFDYHALPLKPVGESLRSTLVRYLQTTNWWENPSIPYPGVK